MRYIGIDGEDYESVAELAEANKRVENDPLYVKEMKRRALINKPGKITREEWQKLSAQPEKPKEKLPVKEKPVKIMDIAVKRKYSRMIPDEYRSVLRRANAKGIEFDLSVEQVESLLEKKCHFCGIESVTLITLGKKFDYPNSKGVCGECKSVYDLLGDRMMDYLDRFIK